MAAETLTSALNDQALLGRFAQESDAQAFAELQRRYGTMVLATCRRHLGNTPDADDAFQAVFLVLVRRVRSIRQHGLLGPWLHAVAVRSARKALALRQRRQSRERQGMTMPEPTCEPDEPRDWLPLLDDAIQGLAEKYRIPLLMCELQGVSRAEAAERLRLSPGTLSSRLARARDMLRERLVRRGVGVTALALAAVLASQASASVAPGLIASTTQAALTGALSAPVAVITQGVLHAMFIAKAKFAAVLMLGLSVFLTGAGLLAWGLTSETPQAAQKQPENKDKDALQGEWKVVTVQMVGKPNADEEARINGKPFVFKGDKLITRAESDYRLDPSKKPKEIDIVPTEGPDGEKGKTFRGIYELKGNDLKISFNGPNQARPKTFDEDGTMAFVLKRAKGE
jgi:RNA polymerase sigma factor (sigma-70 family)